MPFLIKKIHICNFIFKDFATHEKIKEKKYIFRDSYLSLFEKEKHVKYMILICLILNFFFLDDTNKLLL